MYGTIARMRVKPGMEGEFKRIAEKEDSINIPGYLGSFIFKMDANPNEYYMVALFTDKKTYVDNARSPEQDSRYREMRSLLESDPEWHDGEVIYSTPRQPGLRL